MSTVDARLCAKRRIKRLTSSICGDSPSNGLPSGVSVSRASNARTWRCSCVVSSARCTRIAT